MALIMRYIDTMHDYMNKTGDPRTADFPLMSSPVPTMLICLSYVYFVKVLGPRLMENRKPMQFKNTLIAYNFFQVIFSAWLFYECLMGGWLREYSFRCQPVDKTNSGTALRIGMSGWFTGFYSYRCQPVDYSNHPSTLRLKLAIKYQNSVYALACLLCVLILFSESVYKMAILLALFPRDIALMVHACWWYYFSKFTEFFDTIFFVLRKKNDHVSTLHVIHHGCMPMSVWFGVKFTPGGHSTFFGFLNTFVHIIMYTYYLLSALGPHMQRYLWWKKYLTALQMVQFVLIMVHAFQLLFIECDYPRAFVWWIGMHAVMFFFLFNEFYKQAYHRKQKALATLANGNAVKMNGTIAQKDAQTPVKNGSAKVSDYYINGEISAGLHHRTTEVK